MHDCGKANANNSHEKETNSFCDSTAGCVCVFAFGWMGWVNNGMQTVWSNSLNFMNKGASLEWVSKILNLGFFVLRSRLTVG